MLAVAIKKILLSIGNGREYLRTEIKTFIHLHRFQWKIVLSWYTLCKNYSSQKPCFRHHASQQPLWPACLATSHLNACMIYHSSDRQTREEASVALQLQQTMAFFLNTLSVTLLVYWFGGSQQSHHKEALHRDGQEWTWRQTLWRSPVTQSEPWRQSSGLTCVLRCPCLKSTDLLQSQQKAWVTNTQKPRLLTTETVRSLIFAILSS